LPIERIHWSLVPKSAAPPAIAGPCVAIWPGPVDYDACFSAQGFTDFADSDATWNRQFAEIVSRLFTGFSRAGNPSLVAGEIPVRRVGWLRRREMGTLQDALLCAARNDNFRPCTVGFGSPVQAQLTASDGHPIVFVQPGADLPVEDVLAGAAAGLPLVRTDLNWKLLAQEHHRLIRRCS
jgi:hypothetical protein